MASPVSPSPSPSSSALGLPREPKYDNYLYEHPDQTGRHLSSLFPWIILLGILLFLLLVAFVAWFITERARARAMPVPPAGDLQLPTHFVLPPEEEESAAPSSSSSETGVFDEMMIGIGR